MADLQISPDQLAKAREEGYSDDEIASHLSAKSPEKFKAARDEGYSSTEILNHLSGSKPTATQPVEAPQTSILQDLSSGVKHGVKDAYRGGASTLKNIGGVDVGEADKADPNYKPANVTGGSWNPLKWNYRDVPKLIAEQSPMAAAALASAEVGGSVGSLINPGVGTVIGGTIGAATPYALQMMGDGAKRRAVNRTGDPEAVPTTSDKLIGGGTAAGSAALTGLMHTPVGAPFGLAAAGIRGVGNIAANLGSRAAVGAASGVAQNAVSQAGEKIGTDVPFDTASLPESAVGGAASITPHLLPAVAAGTRALRMGKYNADPEAAANYSTRLQNTGLDLNNIHEAAQAHAKVMADTHGELKAALDNVAQQKALSPEETNAVASIRRGDTITPKDMEHLATATANTPDGPNAHFLARALKTGQQAEGEGSFNPDTGWQGSATGGMKNVVRGVFNPWHIGGTMAGLGALAFGMPHVSGAVGGGLMGGLGIGLGGARLLDSITGGSRPAANFAQTFADHNAQLRMGQPPPLPQQPPPLPQAPNAPWGPRPPMSGPTGPQVAPPGAPPQAAPQAPQFNPMALQMLKQKLKAGLPPEPTPTPEAPTAPPAKPDISPMALSMLRQKLKQGLPPEQTPTPEAPPAPPAKPDISPMALSMLRQKLKQGLPPEPAPTPEAPPAPTPTAPPSINPLMLPRDVTGPAKSIVKGIENSADMQDAATKPAASAIPAAAMKITKSKGGDVKATDPYESAGDFSPVTPDRMVYRGLTPEQIGDKVARERPELPEMNRMGLRNAVTQTHAARDAVKADLTNQLPLHAETLHALGEQLKEPGNSDIQYSHRVIKHYTNQMDPESSHIVRERYKSERENLWPTTAEKRAAARKKAKAKKEG